MRPAPRANASSSASSSAVTGTCSSSVERGQVELAEVEQPGELGHRARRGRRPAGRPRCRRGRRTRRPRGPRAAPRTAARGGRRRPGRRRSAPSSSRRARRRLRVGRQPRGLHRLDDVRRRRGCCPGWRTPVAGDAAGPVEAGVPGVRGRAAVDVDDPDLPVVAALVVLEQPLQRDRRGRAVVAGAPAPGPCRRRSRRPGSRSRRRRPPRPARRNRRPGTSTPRPPPRTLRRRTGPRSRRSWLAP